MKKLLNRECIGVMPLLFGASLVCIGLFHEYLACVASVCLLVYLAVLIRRQGALHIKKNLTGLFLLLLVAGYLLSCLWAVDIGMAFIGFLKFLPVLLFWLALIQKPGSTETLLSILPPLATAMTVVSIVGMNLPFSAFFFSVAGRLAGFFQYPNTFAALLLIAELMVVMRDTHSWRDYVYFAVLVGGILYTGSRAVFLLALVANVVAIFFSKDKRFRWSVLITAAAVAVAGVAYMLLSGNTALMDRLLSISFTESTFVGRLLYYQDALPTIAQRPFGLGYLGYLYLQRGFQTGVYSVRCIHNDFLQVLLDVGWIPFVAMVSAVIATLKSKRVTKQKKLLLVVLALHSAFDFDLQYIAMFFLFVLLLDPERGEDVKLSLSRRRAMAMSTCIVAAVGCLYMGVTLAFARFGLAEVSYHMYPANTENACKLLSKAEDIKDANVIADEILARNKYVVEAYKVKARGAYAAGDFGALMKIKRQAIQLAPFEYKEYEEYAHMLVRGIALYSQSKDKYSVEACRQELVWIRRELQSLPSRQSALGKLIDDQPTTQLPQEIDQHIAGMTSR